MTLLVLFSWPEIASKDHQPSKPCCIWYSRDRNDHSNHRSQPEEAAIAGDSVDGYRRVDSSRSKHSPATR